MEKILIIEDEQELAEILGAYLKVEGMETRIAYDGKQGYELYEKENPDLILLDIMLPQINGVDICKMIREHSDVPVIMISAKDGEMDKVIALGVGADDYVTKPFSPLELVARVKAQLRRYHGMTGRDSSKNGNVLTVGELNLSKVSYTAYTKDHTEITFTTKEFEILYCLAESKNQVLSKEQIYQNVWGYAGICDDNSVTVYINRIREKLAQYGMDYIKTVWGAGYKLAIDEMV